MPTRTGSSPPPSHLLATQWWGRVAPGLVDVVRYVNGIHLYPSPADIYLTPQLPDNSLSAATLYACEVCQRGFTNKQHVPRHVNDVHTKQKRVSLVSFGASEDTRLLSLSSDDTPAQLRIATTRLHKRAIWSRISGISSA